MRMLVFAKRNVKEIVRDPLTLFFGIAFPSILLLLLTIIQHNVPAEASPFPAERLTPSITIFGLSFITLFSALIVSKDRSGSLLQRLLSSPMTASDFLGGYALPLVPLVLAQGIVCYALGMALGFKASVNVLTGILMLLPCSTVFAGMGLLFGSILTDKQVGGICGALITNLTAWLSGTFFSLDLVGKAFKTFAYALPFAHAVDLCVAAANGNYADMFPHLWVVLAYGAALCTAAVIVFKKKMK